MYQISYNEQNYPRVAVVDFDHGNGAINYSQAPSGEFHYLFEDNVGLDYYLDENDWDHAMNLSQYYGTHLLYDMDIYPQTTLGKTCFTFISTCNSANVDNIFGQPPYQYDSAQGLINGTRARGMPYAWTHRTVANKTDPEFTTALNMSIDGYGDADNGPHCYIGFYMGSAALNQTVNASGPAYHQWLEKFFDYALTDDYTVNEALNLATQYYFYCNFNDTEHNPLYGGFMATWPMWNTTSNTWDNNTGMGWLKVYGNGNIKLYQPLLALDGRDSYGNPVFPDFTVNGTSVGTSGSDPRLIAGNYTVDATSPVNYTFSHFSCDGVNYYSRPASISVPSDRTLTAYYTITPQPHPPTTPSLSCPSQPPLYILQTYNFTAQATDPDGNNIYYIFDWGDGTAQTTIGPVASGTAVTASHSWSDSGQYIVKVRAQDSGGASSEWSTPLSITIYEVPEPPVSYYMLTMEAYDSAGSPVTANVYIDGQLRGTTGQSFNVSSYAHQIQVSVPDGYAFFSCNYWAYTLYTNPCTISLFQDTTVTVHFAWSDPKASTAASVSDAVAYPTERKSFYANGRFWVFYNGLCYDDYYILYKTSTDGVTWSAPTQLSVCSSGMYFSTYFDGTYLHYVNTCNGLFYRRGLPNANGTITWSAPEQNVLPSGTAPATVCVDSNGYPFIGYNSYNGSYVSSVTKSSTNDGTWSTAPGFPHYLATSSYYTSATVVPMTEGKIYALYQTGGNAKGKLWTGSSWGNQENVAGGYCDSIVSQNDVIYTAYDAVIDIDEYGNAVCAIYCAKRTSFWDSPQLIQHTNSRAVVSLSSESSTNNLYYFWAPQGGSGANHIYFKKNVNGTWSTTTDWIRDCMQYPVTMASFTRSCENKTGVVWMTPYPYRYMRFAYLNMSDTPISYSLSVPAYDNIGGFVSANVYIDGQLVGVTGNSFDVLPGDHTIQVTVPNGFVFQNYTYTGCVDSNNPAWIPIYSNMTLTVNYAYSHYNVSIPAIDDFGSPVTANITIDGQPCGTTGGTFNMSLGTHTIQVSVPSGYSFRSYIYGSITNYTNPAALPISSNANITVNYLRINTPSAVDTTVDPSATKNPSQRKSFFANGRFWVFYTNIDEYYQSYFMYYKTSADGINWGTATQVSVCYGNCFSIYFDGAYVHYANAWDGLCYRRGTPNADGTITWSTVQQRVLSPASGPTTICVDSNGYPFITYYNGSCYNVIKSSLNNGTWSTAPGFPYWLASSSWGVCVVPMLSGKVYVVYANGGYIYGRMWNGSAWGNQETAVGSGTAYYLDLSVVTEGDTVHLVYVSYGFTLYYVTRTSSWSSPQNLHSWGIYAYVVPSLSLDASTGDLYCFWTGVPTEDHIYYKRCVNGTWDTIPTDWITDDLRNNNVMSSFYQSGGNRIGVIWLTPYPDDIIKFSYLNLPDS